MTEVFSFPGDLTERGLASGFGARVPGIAGSRDKREALAELAEAHRREVEALGFSWSDLALAEQVHGTVVLAAVPGEVAPGADGLVTDSRGVLLGIHVADCAAVGLVDERTGALALVHSGRKGSEGGIVGVALEEMARRYGTGAGDVWACISPCIRPPHYEVDFVSLIHEQLRGAGIGEARIGDCGICTGENVAEFYSYRIEEGKTGRMLALLGWRKEEP